MDALKHTEGEPIVISLDEARETTNDFAQAINAVVRPIWSHIQSLLNERERIAVAIAGGSAVGKSDFFTPALTKGLPSTLLFSEDDYCVGNSVSRQRFGEPNLHVPEDFDPELLAGHVAALKRGEVIEKPVYSYELRERVSTTRVSVGRVLVVEGEFLLHPPLSDQFDVKVFINSDDHSRFVRRMIRPRRNPNQTDVERVLEYFRLSFPHYHSHIDTSMSNADFVIENGYHPEEGHARIEDCEIELLLEGNDAEHVFSTLYPRSERRSFTRQYFAHSKQTPPEVLYVHSDEACGHHFRYSPGVKERSQAGINSPWVRFDLEKMPVDLKDVGYTPTVKVEGQEWYLVTEGVSLRLIKLPHDREVLQIVQSTKSASVANGRGVVQQLLTAGLTRSEQTLDEWIKA